jgi:antitoxin HigA-1
MVRIPTHGPPTPPGEFLLEFLQDRGVSQSELARRIHVPFQRVNDVIHGRRAVSASTALRLGKFFNMSAEFWMNAQRATDLYRALQEEQDVLDQIDPVAS